MTVRSHCAAPDACRALPKSGHCYPCRSDFLRDNPEIMARHAQKITAWWSARPPGNARTAWCPVEWRGVYFRLRGRDFRAAEARAIIEADIARGAVPEDWA